MAIQMDIQVADDLPDSLEEPPSSSQIINWAQAAWQGEANAQPVISLRIISSAESQQLNSDYRGKNNPTNVLSFPMELDLGNEELQMLGDLAICAEVVACEAAEQHKTLSMHWAHMLVHGMLHLQGFDHIENAEAQQMENLETQILRSLGFADPYRDDLLTLTNDQK